MEKINQEQKRIIEVPIVKREEKQSLKRDELINAFFAQISAQSETLHEQDERVDYDKKQVGKYTTKLDKLLIATKIKEDKIQELSCIASQKVQTAEKVFGIKLW